MSKASEYQPDPKQGEQVVVDVVLADIRERAETGKRKYGTYLETNNGRNPLWDAYQEAIDLVMYLRQALLEQERHLTTACRAQASKANRWKDYLMTEEDYATYKKMYFAVFPTSNLEGMAKELHAALIAYQTRICELEAFQQSVERILETGGDLHTEVLKIKGSVLA